MRSIQKTYYTVSASTDSKIVLISDIHYYNRKMKPLLDQIFENIKEILPNYICIPGDFIDEAYIKDEDIFLEFLKELGTISPVVISIGNHEVKVKKEKKPKRNQKLLNRISCISNVHLLDNISWIDKDICFTGLTLPCLSYKEKSDSYRKTLSTINKYFPKGLDLKKYHIVLSHSPASLVHPKIMKHKFYKNANLILSGHTHAGLAPKFFLRMTGRGLVTPERHPFPKEVYGYLKDKKTIISSGMTKLSHTNPFRYFNFLYRGEIVIISLQKD